eukprot:SAG22_NODE_77_length_22125_cov_46.140016_20_plen_73_part_00
MWPHRVPAVEQQPGVERPAAVEDVGPDLEKPARARAVSLLQPSLLTQRHSIGAEREGQQELVAVRAVRARSP